VSERPVTLFGPWPPPAGGIATHMTQLRAALHERGVRTRVLAYGDGPMAEGVDPITFRPRMRFVRSFQRAVRGSRVLHGHSWLTSHPDMTALRGYAWLIRWSRTGWVETLHSGSLADRFATWSNRDQSLYARILGRADRLIAVSEPIAAFLGSIGMAAPKVVIIGPLLPAGLDTEEEPLAQVTADFARVHRPLIVAVGAMLPTYDYEALALAFSGIYASERSAGLILVSTGAAVNEPYRALVRMAFKDHRSRVLELEDVPRAQLIALMRRASVVVRAFPVESYGLSRVEALLSGTPVVATRAGEQAFVIPYEDADPDSLRSALRQALDSPRPEPALVRAHFSRLATANLEAIIDVYEACPR
jgi:glycosyltransferase involved in cell wall biosynthesis